MDACLPRWARVAVPANCDSLGLVLLGEERVDLRRQVGDLLCQLLVLQRELGVRLEQLEELVGLRLRGSLQPTVALLDSIGVELVTVSLARLREQDQRRRVGSLK